MRGVLDHRLEFLSDLPFHSRFTQFPSTPPSTPLNPNKPNTYTASAPVTPHTRPRLPLSTSLPLYRSTTARGHRAAPPTHTTRGLLQPGRRRRRRHSTPLASSTSHPVPLYLSTTARSPPKTPRYAARGLLQPDRRRRRRRGYRCNSPVPPPTSHLHERDLPHAQHHTRTSGAQP